MKIKKFNEQVDEDKKDIDPYGEEKWEGEEIDPDRFKFRSGICFNCGSENIMYGDSDLHDNQIEYEYYCNNCESDGAEVYELEFLMNVRK